MAVTLFSCLLGCHEINQYEHEAFYGVVKFSEEADRTIIYIPSIGDVEIPENEGCCSCFDGHEPNEDYSYQLKSGDLVKINFSYEKSWDDNGVKIMESYPARFDRASGIIEVLREYISFGKDENGYVFSFPTTDQIENAEIGDTLYFVYHEGENGQDSTYLYATGEITDTEYGITTVRLSIIKEESVFLKKYSCMSVELNWEY